MGGANSGRWKSHNRMPIVEETITINLLASFWREALGPDEFIGEIVWEATENEPKLKCEFHLSLTKDDETKLLSLSFDDNPRDKRRQTITLCPSQAGIRKQYSAICPSGCGAKILKLYKTPNELFACRQCSGLQYKSSQQHDNRVSKYQKDPDKWLEERSEYTGVVSEWVTLRTMLEATTGVPRATLDNSHKQSPKQRKEELCQIKQSKEKLREIRKWLENNPRGV